MDANKLVTALLRIKDRRSELNAEFETADKELKDKQARVEQAILGICKENGMDSLSIVTDDYKVTCSRVIKERVWPADWDAFREFEQENPDYDFREKRVAQKTFHEFMEAHPEATPPVNIDREFAVALRRTKR